MSYNKEQMKKLVSLMGNVRQFDGKVKLKKEYSDEWIEQNKENLVQVSVLDVEATGLSHLFDEIIELAIVPVLLDTTNDYEPVKVLDGYNEHNEPSDISKITEEITELTGISQDDVKGKSIDWTIVNKICDESVAIIAHNAKYDSKMVFNYPEYTSKTEWFCSQNEINWYDKNMPNRKQEMLCLALELKEEGLGFEFTAHRAITDVLALIQLLVSTNSFAEVLEPSVELKAYGFVSKRFNKSFYEPNRMYLRKEGDNWVNVGTFKQGKIEEMKEFIQENALKEREFQGETRELKLWFKEQPARKKYGIRK